MDIPEWATDIVRFEGGTLVYFNKERWEYISEDEVDSGEWPSPEILEDYLRSIKFLPHTREKLNICLENK